MVGSWSPSPAPCHLLVGKRGSPSRAAHWAHSHPDSVSADDEGDLSAPRIDEAGPAGVQSDVLAIPGTEPNGRIVEGLPAGLHNCESGSHVGVRTSGWCSRQEESRGALHSGISSELSEMPTSSTLWLSIPRFALNCNGRLFRSFQKCHHIFQDTHISASLDWSSPGDAQCPLCLWGLAWWGHGSSTPLARSAPLPPQWNLPHPGKPTVKAGCQSFTSHKGTHKRRLPLTDGARAQAQSQGIHPHSLVTNLTRLHWLISGFIMKGDLLLLWMVSIKGLSLG